MSQNIPGIKAVKTVNNSYEIKLDNAKNDSKTDTNLEKSDENSYLDMDFDNMSLEETVNAAQDLNEEVLYLQAEIETLETLISSDEEIKAMYENQRDAIKKELEQLQEKLLKAETPDEKAELRQKMVNLRRQVSSLNSEISSLLYTLQGHNAMKADSSSDLLIANQNYGKAKNAQNAKEMELNRSESAQDVSSSGVSTTSSSVNSTNPKSQSGASSGKVSDVMVNAVKNWEGLMTDAYVCPAGVLTIGYGHTGSDVYQGQHITEAEADSILRKDLASFESQVTKEAQKYGVSLTQGQFDALTSFTMNGGLGMLQKSGILESLKNGDIDGAANKMKQYTHGGGKVLPGLVKRREIEASWLYT